MIFLRKLTLENIQTITSQKITPVKSQFNTSQNKMSDTSPTLLLKIPELSQLLDTTFKNNQVTKS